jgi:hypothetical protein
MTFSNSEIVTIALYLLGGDTKSIETEDVAIKADELSPGRFRWKKYKDQINLASVNKRLWDAKKDSVGSFVTGSEKEGWLLTIKGVEFAKKNVNHLVSKDSSKNRLSLQEQKWRKNEYNRLVSEPAYTEFKKGNIESITEREIEAFFRLNEYIVGKNREKKVRRIINAFGDDPELGEAVHKLSNKIRKR